MSELAPGAWILQLEQRSRQQGSAIRGEDLPGNWRLVELWDRQARPLAPQARLLQGLRAQLGIHASPGESPGHQPDSATTAGLTLNNTVRIGALELAFVGPGWLQGRRPLLRFRFEQLQLHLGPWRLWQMNLPTPANRNEPFFALIASGQDAQGRWLLARGRGGGLARWRCP